MRERVCESITLTASGQIFTGDGVLNSMFLGLDKLNDPAITVYEGTDNTGDEKVPTNDYDASTLGLNGFVDRRVKCRGGAYYEVAESGGGSSVAVFDFYPGGTTDDESQEY